MRYVRRTALLGFLAGGLTALWAAAPAAAQHPPVVRGRVVEEGTARPVAGARIQVADGTSEAVSSHDGAFLLRGLLPGTRTLRIEALGYATRSATVEARNGRVADVRLELRPLPLELPGVEAERIDLDSPPPGAVVMDASTIRRSGARDVGELLSSVSGVVVTRRGGPGSSASVSIRGSSADQVLVLVDGVPANSLLSGEADLSTLPVEGLERVVVLRGGASFRYGGRALGGVILLESGMPAAEDLSLRAGAGSFGSRSAGLEASGGLDHGQNGELSGTLSAKWSQSASDFDYLRPPERGGGRARRANADASRRSLRGAGEWIPGDGAPELQVRLEAVELERGMPGPVVQPSTTGRQEQTRYGAVLSASGSRAPSTWRIALQLQRQEASYRDPDPPLGPAFDEDARVDGVGLMATTEGRIRHLGWEAGLEARRYRVHATSLAPGGPDGQSTLGLWGGARLSGEPLEGWRLTGGPGIRVDLSSRIRGSWISPRVGGALSRGPVTGRVTLSSSFSPPSLSDQFFQEGVLVRPNPELRPERVRPEVEAGLDVELGLGPARVRLTGEVFRADVRGMILWSPDHRFVWSPRNVDVTRRGGELRTRVALPRPGLTLEGALSRAQVEYDGPVLEGQVVYRPELTADLRLEWSLDHARAELEARYTGTRRTVPGSAINALEPFWTVDLRLERRFRPGGVPVEAGVRIDNLLDARASILPDYPRPGRALGLEIRATPFDSTR